MTTMLDRLHRPSDDALGLGRWRATMTVVRHHPRLT